MHATQARNMALGQLITNSIRDPRVLEAMKHIPREMFVPESLSGSAYADEDLPISGDRYLLAPLTFAKLIAYARITRGCRVLNVGALAGYTAAVIARLASHVVATETDEELAEYMQESMEQLDIRNVSVHEVKNLADGYPSSAPYDVIVIDGGIQKISGRLTSQLALNGRLVAVRVIAKRPDAPGGMGRGIVVQRQHDHFYTTEHFDAPAVVLPGFSD